jgi:hypothetical protein
MIRTTLRTGLPFSPLPVTVDGVALGVVSPEVQWHMERPEVRPYDLPSELSALGRVFTLPGTPTEALGLLALIPLLLWPLGIRRLATRHPPALVLIVIAVIATLFEYYDADFAMIRYYWSASSSRFLLPAVALLTPVSLLWCERSSRASRIYLWVLSCATFVNMLAYAVTGFSTVSFRGTCAMLAGAIALAAMAPALGTRRGALAFAALVVAGFVGLHSLRWVLRDELILRDFVLHPVGTVPNERRNASPRSHAAGSRASSASSVVRQKR